MSDLDSLNQKLKDSMTIFGAQERPKEATPAAWPRTDFGNTAFKTDAQQVSLANQVDRFRKERAETNPFESMNELGSHLVDE